jgi:uncharacterized protein
MNIAKPIRRFYERFISLQGEPGAVAAGLAMGVFVGVTPTIPFHTAIIIVLAFLFRLNIPAAYLGSWVISNPLTIPFLYVSQYELGQILLGMQHVPLILSGYSLGEILTTGGKILFPLQVGGILMAPFIALPAYFISYHLLKVVRKKGRS